MFRRQAEKIWSEAELAVLVDHLGTNPQDGDVIPGTGGIRKLRWGKIYFFHNADMPLYLLLAYAKAQATDFTQDEKRTLTALAAAIKQGKG